MRTSVVLLLILGMSLLAADRPAWRARRRPETQPNRLATQRVQPSDWPAEPDSPTPIDPARFEQALRTLCGWLPPSRSASYTQWILENGAAFGEDPFLLGALVYRQSRCRPDKQELGGQGLTLIPYSMYRSGFRGRSYHYRVRVQGVWQDRVRALDRFAFAPARLFNAEANLYFTAALLSVWREQHATVDSEFEQEPHRHHVSHWVWGDRVRSDRAEDRILTDRRRLLQYYGALEPWPAMPREGLRLGSPLDGAPRVVSSGLGDPRSDGKRKHRGVDIESEFGEPVRAIADGKVSFAGVDLPGRQHHQAMHPAAVAKVPRRELGRGGRFVCLIHARPDGAPLRSCSMHLETIAVRQGERVERGQLIGTVGRTGMRRSSPHLHFEIHDDNGIRDPLALLRGALIGDPPPPPKPWRKRKRTARVAAAR